MSIWQSSFKLQLVTILGLSGWLMFAVLPGRAGEVPNRIAPAQMVAQSNRTQINNVRLQTTAKGVEVILETVTGKLAPTTTGTQDRTTYIDIPNAVLSLPDGKEFRAENPATGIVSVVVTQLTPDSVRVTIAGTEGAPTAQVVEIDRGLTISSTPAQPTAQASDVPEIEINVTGLSNRRGYKLPNATTATKTDTPIKDIPQSIQVVPPEVLRDRNVRSVTEALETVSGVATGSRSFNGAPITLKIIRGFDQGFTGTANFRDGFPDGDFYVLSPIGTVDRVEVLKGPASVLFGAGEPGGIVNTVTKKPLNKPYYNLGFEVGNYGLYQPRIDFSGPLNTDKTALYRFIASYRGSGDFQGFANTKLTTIAPSVAVKLGDRTDLNIYYEYSNLFGDPASGDNNAALLSNGRLTPRNVAIYYPSLAKLDVTSQRFGYTYLDP